MIAVDTNVLVYAHRMDSDFHEPAATAVRELAESPAAWAIPWPCLHEFVAIATHPRIYAPPSSLAQAFEQVDAWLESPSLVLLSEAQDHATQLQEIAVAASARGGRVHDARVAAICLSHGVRELWSVDRDFARFPKLRVSNPLH
ncbi:MAG TPA: TA system VapC family ribonuclease toxin [Actinomycetota bacterium]